MEPDGQTYLLPHPAVARMIFAAVGAFALVMAPYELWRGVWPLNVTTPFFGFIMLGGMSVGASALWAGLFAPAAMLRFGPGILTIEYRHLWGSARQTIRAEDIDGFSVEERSNSEGPNDWFAVILSKSGKTVSSRPLGTKDAAERQLAQFRSALQM